MIKHLIEFDNGSKLALEKKQIISLTQALEPYAIAIMLGISEDDLPDFVAEHKKEIGKMITSKKGINNERTKKNTTHEFKKERKGLDSNVAVLKDYKQKEPSHE